MVYVTNVFSGEVARCEIIVEWEENGSVQVLVEDLDYSIRFITPKSTISTSAKKYEIYKKIKELKLHIDDTYSKIKELEEELHNERASNTKENN